MAIFKTEIDKVTEVVSYHLISKIQTELRQKVFEVLREDIDKIIYEVTKDLVSQIESYNNIENSIVLNVSLNGVKLDGK